MKYNYAMAFEPRVVEARLALHLISATEMPRLAWDALEAGLDGPAIRRLAALEFPTFFQVQKILAQAMEEMRFYDKSGGKNRFEACYKFTHTDSSGTTVTKYYGGGAGIYDSAAAVMKDVCDRTVWVFLAHVLPDEEWQDCTTPGPYPAEKW